MSRNNHADYFAQSNVLHIAVGVITQITADGQTRVCISQRRAGKPGAGQWEFPGGKLDRGETVQAALVRELNEELGITVERAEPLIQITHAYSDRAVLLDTWWVREFSGEPRGVEGQAVRWVEQSQLGLAGLLEADAPIVSAILLPRTMVVTPSGFGCSQIRHLTESLNQKSGSVLLRVRQPKSVAVVEAALELADAHVLVVADSDTPEPILARAAGVHFSAASIVAGSEVLGDARARGQWVGASAHTPEQALIAQDAGADYLVVGSVKDTPSHPGVSGMGWSRFQALVAQVQRPVYAIGGLGASDLDEAIAHGAQGIAGIRAFQRGRCGP